MKHWLIIRPAADYGFGKDIWGMTPEEITGSLRVSHNNNLSFNQD